MWGLGVIMKKVILVLAVAVLLTGCAKKPVEEMSYTERTALAQEIVARCHKQGVKSDTPEMEQCITVEAERERYIRRKRAPDPAGAAMLFGGGLANQRRPINCTTVGNNTFCN